MMAKLYLQRRVLIWSSKIGGPHVNPGPRGGKKLRGKELPSKQDLVRQ